MQKSSADRGYAKHQTFTVGVSWLKSPFFGCFIMFLTIFDRISIFHRRKSALPKYDPPYAKRQMLKGYSHPNSPHPSQHLTPDHTFEDAGKLGGLVSGKLGGLGNFPPYRPVE